MDYTLDELREIVTTLKEAHLNSIRNGGVTSYSIKTGQSETNVTQARSASILSDLKYYTQLLNEREQIESGANFTHIRSIGF